LIYDHRGWGSSEGLPRSQVDPLQQAEDYHSAVLFASTLPGIDPNRIVIWGIGHSGGAAMIAGASDRLAKAVVLVMPCISGAEDSQLYPPGWQDRVLTEQLKRVQAPGLVPEYIQNWDNTAAEAQGERNGVLLHGAVAFEFSASARKLSEAAGTPWENRMALQSLFLISRVEMKQWLPHLTRPLLHLAAIGDPLSGPIEHQRAAFATASDPKEFVVLSKPHIENYFEGFEENVKAQLDFLARYV
jgi:uncharacterized protein